MLLVKTERKSLVQEKMYFSACLRMRYDILRSAITKISRALYKVKYKTSENVAYVQYIFSRHHEYIMRSCID